MELISLAVLWLGGAMQVVLALVLIEGLDWQLTLIFTYYGNCQI